MDHNVDNKHKNVNNMHQDVMPVFIGFRIVDFSPVGADAEKHSADYRRPGYLYNAEEKFNKILTLPD